MVLNQISLMFILSSCLGSKFLLCLYVPLSINSHLNGMLLSFKKMSLLFRFGAQVRLDMSSHILSFSLNTYHGISFVHQLYIM